MKSSRLPALAVLALALPYASADTVIYQQSFTPGAGTAGLNGTTPTVGTSNWEAAPTFQADGDFTEGAGSATLAFTPANNMIYTLDASFRNLTATAAAGTIENDWVALGFAKGQSDLAGSDNRFTNTNVIGKAWMLLRGVDTANVNNFTHLGSATSGTNGMGASTSSAWGDSTLASTFGGGMDMRVVLDTTGGTGFWKATWFAKLPTDGAFTPVRSVAGLLSEDINSVGVAISNPGFDGDLTYFGLTAVPEPSSALAGVLLGLGLLRRRR